ncbi:MAG: 50S ribosomal protein L28 [Candidatus Omnitrophica bacterium]|jgi:large subunit ribosomal protein L28|nr:50S ribosomal protein L28 [Candidatus Omnitrophota bacterium]
MLKQCAICGKKALTGKKVVRKGMPKKQGGTGSKISRWSKRSFNPNLQKMRLLVKGKTVRAFVCAKCIKKGGFTKVAGKSKK